jgi:signal transduction histidine kinase
MEVAREQRLELRSIALADLLAEIIELWQPVAAAHGIQLTLDASGENRIEADELQLKRVLDNLVKNAIEAIGRGPGRIDLSVGNVPGRVRISIADSGPGFPDSIEGFRLFETTKPQGTGLGLAVARQIVLAHGGEIDFVPAEPHGTVFRIDLPSGGPAASSAR